MGKKKVTFKTGVHKIRVPGRPSNWIFYYF